MSDDKVRLPDDVESAIEVYGDAVRRTCGDSGPEDYVALENASDALRRVIARTVADDDAREERLRDLPQKVSTLLSALRGEQGVEVGGVVLNPCADRDERDAMLRAAQARAERAEAERDSARALLNALRLCFDSDTPSGKATLARIDAELGGGK